MRQSSMVLHKEKEAEKRIKDSNQLANTIFQNIPQLKEVNRVITMGKAYPWGIQGKGDAGPDSLEETGANQQQQ